MKKTKRLLALFFALCMTFTLLPSTVMAVEEEPERDITFELAMAKDLKELGLFQGVGTNEDSSTDFDLKRAPTRLEALIMLIRLLGYDADAKSYIGECPFTDVPAWGKSYVAYAYANKLTNGVSATQFGMANANAAMYMTFVLRALGYSDAEGGQFTWDDPFTLAKALGLLLEGVNVDEFWREDVVAISYAALYAKVKDTKQTLSDVLIDRKVFSDTQFEDCMDERLLLAHTTPEIKIVGDWPCDEELLHEKWAEIYPYYCRYLGLPTKILTEGITWEWDDSITAGTVGYYAETNSFMMGPLPQHNNFNSDNNYDYEPLVMQCLHESAHLFWQVGSSNLDFSFGQWAWEAAALVAECLYFADVHDDYNAGNINIFDLVDYCGAEAVNGVRSDGNKYSRTVVDGNATSSFVYLASVLSDEGTHNYFQKVNDLRLKHYEETGERSVSLEEYATMLDEAAEGRTIDGMKPSQWFTSLAVSNIDGAIGDYIIAYPFRIRDDRVAVNFACWNRFTDEHGDKIEKGYANQEVKINVYDANGSLVGNGTAKTRDQGEGSAEIIGLTVASEISALKIVAETTLNGEKKTSETYSIYSKHSDNKNMERTYLILIDENGDIVGDLKESDIKVTGAKSVDTSALAGGVLIFEATTGNTVTIVANGHSFEISQTFGIRVMPITVQ